MAASHVVVNASGDRLDRALRYLTAPLRRCRSGMPPASRGGCVHSWKRLNGERQRPDVVADGLRSDHECGRAARQRDLVGRPLRSGRQIEQKANRVTAILTRTREVEQHEMGEVIE